MSHDQSLGAPSRRGLYDRIEANPGAHLRELSRRAGMPLGTTLYHLDRLERQGAIVSRRDGRYKRFFCAGGMGRREKDLVCALRHEAPRRLLSRLLEHPGATQRELSEEVGLSRSTVSLHLSRLVAEGFVSRTDDRPEGRYLVAESQRTRTILERYPDSFGEGGPPEGVEEGPVGPTRRIEVRS